MTAEQLYDNLTCMDHPESYGVCKKDAIELMKNFARYHVEKALSEACKNVKIETEEHRYEGVFFKIPKLIKSSVINAYPLENIK